jgi:hypothetical protein
VLENGQKPYRPSNQPARPEIISFIFIPFFLIAMNPFLFLRPALLGIAALMTTTARAQATPPVQLTQPDASSLRLSFINSTSRPASLTVVDLTRSSTILNETHREPAYGTRLKFDTLPSGRYLVALRIGRDRYRYTVEVAAKARGNTSIAVLETTTHRVENGLTTAAL